jgi:hypothetical protein
MSHAWYTTARWQRIARPSAAARATVPDVFGRPSVRGAPFRLSFTVNERSPARPGHIPVAPICPVSSCTARIEGGGDANAICVRSSARTRHAFGSRVSALPQHAVRSACLSLATARRAITARHDHNYHVLSPGESGRLGERSMATNGNQTRGAVHIRANARARYTQPQLRAKLRKSRACSNAAASSGADKEVR